MRKITTKITEYFYWTLLNSWNYLQITEHAHTSTQTESCRHGHTYTHTLKLTNEHRYKQTHGYRKTHIESLRTHRDIHRHTNTQTDTLKHRFLDCTFLISCQSDTKSYVPSFTYCPRTVCFNNDIIMYKSPYIYKLHLVTYE